MLSPTPPQLQGLLPRRLTSGFLKREQRATKTPRGRGRTRSPTSPVPSQGCLCSLGTGRLPGKHEGNISKQKQATNKHCRKGQVRPGVQAELLETRPGSSGSGSRGRGVCGSRGPGAGKPSVRPAHRLLTSHPRKKTGGGGCELTRLHSRENKGDGGGAGGHWRTRSKCSFQVQRAYFA